MDQFPSPVAGSSLDRAGQAHSRKSIRRSQPNQPSSAVNSTPLSATNSALERYRNAVEHPDSAVAASAWRRSSRRFEHLPDTPLLLQRPDSHDGQTRNQADAVSPAVSDILVQAPDRTPSPENLSAEAQDSPADHNGTEISSSTQNVTRRVQAVSGMSTPARQPEVATFSRENTIHGPHSGSPPASAPDSVQKEDSTDNSTAQRSLDPSTALELQHDQQWSAWQEHRKLSEEAHDPRSTRQWTRPARGEIRKPQLVSEKTFEREIRKILSKEAYAELDKSPSAEAKRDPLLYDNLPDKLRQKTVDMWLLRSDIAFLVKDWRLMESHGRQAQKLAIDLQWEPFIAKCAFPIGIALFMQNDMFGAYESMVEAEKTKGYYISRTKISHWLEKINAKLDESEALWSYGVSAKPGERVPSITPLASVIEEEQEFRLPRAELEALESEILEDIHPSSLEASAAAPEIPASSDAPKKRPTTAPPVQEIHDPASEANLATMRGPTLLRSVPPHSLDNLIGNAPNNLSLAPSVPPGLMLTAIRLASNPVPASISTPRLYDPALPPLGPSPPLRGDKPQLRSGLILPQTHPASGLSEMVLPDAAHPSPRSAISGNRNSASELEKSPLPAWAIPQTDEPDKSARQPLDLS
ncbi:MAG: hypothetical protein Q9211_006273, partial [Gyalolechia sp. 1 TL-2023]